MRKYVLMALIAFFAIGAEAQKMTTTQTLKTTDLGNQKLEMAVTDNDTVFALTLATGYHGKRVVVGLGNKADAIRLLKYLAEAKVKVGDIVDMENATHNVAVWRKINGYEVFSEGRAFSGHLQKRHCKIFIETIEKR